MKGGHSQHNVNPIKTSLETKKKPLDQVNWWAEGTHMGAEKWAQVPLKLVSQWGQSMESTNSVILLKPAIYFALALPSYKCCNLSSGQVSKTPDLLIYNEMFELVEHEVHICQKSWQWLFAIGGGRGVDLNLYLDSATGQNPKWSKRDRANITSYQSPSHQFFFLWGNHCY